MNKKILIITSNFHPYNTSGTLRINSFCKAFFKHGYTIDVLTRDSQQSYERCPFDTSNEVRVFRAPARDIKHTLSFRGWYPSLLGIPDRYWTWYFTSKCLFKHLSQSYTVMLSSSPVQTAHLIAHRLKTKFGWPLICDFRDPWVLSKKAEKCSWYQLILEKWLESKAVRAADLVTVTNDRFKEYFASKYKKEVHTISNGFVPQDFSELKPHKAQPDKLTFCHAGSLYGQYRDPSPLLKAMSELKLQKVIDSNRFVLQLIGGGEKLYSSEFQKLLTDLGIQDMVDIVPRVTHKESLEFMMAADCLVLLQCDPALRFQIPAKLYEYLYCKKPILGMVAPGATEDILLGINHQWIVRPDDQLGLQRYIELFLAGDDALFALPSDEAVKAFSRDIQAEQLFRLAEKIEV